MLQSTLGNLPELFVVIFALPPGEVVVAQTSIIGSMFANALLVLGLVIVVGARAASDGVMRFSTRLPNDTATLLLVADVHHRARRARRSRSHDPASHHVKAISTIGAVVPAGRLRRRGWSPYLRSDRAAARPSEDGEAAAAAAARRRRSRCWRSRGVGAAFVSDWFIAALRPTIDAARRLRRRSPAS